METVECDDRGRVLLSRDVRRDYGRKFFVVRAAGEVVLVPVPADPLKAMREEWRKAGLDKFSLTELKRLAERRAREEALNGVR